MRDFQDNLGEYSDAEQLAFCEECSQVVSVRTISINHGEDSPSWETTCINGHMVDED
jgi:hypothetical protein